ncbi:cell division protein PerM [Corynebacterium pseudodiphtheriticum]|uniref:DUF6350 family protein n=1 Tax=Corynebacterium pseudodiphtheriticum TaxID=37637 RepID=A0ABT7FT55_9CORY|nr:DUF6350 family protein [Corynebacterium pseudodiphtheriticum]MDK4289163.1 DUF6350 family protein [Corynebacterium pseudodiphtheriticum]MDK4328585.1 DUF6350 family protein [Corynebacterium pseudodiphtheriticum]UNU75831.1 hypothetical protein HH207_09010 [Corynebacterium pseudodiphtheriticum]UNU76896.1 hypothetical protein HH208_03205 [Corynebacterium pseudodiphtheriticum]
MNSNSSPHSRAARRPQRRPRTAPNVSLPANARRGRVASARGMTRGQRVSVAKSADKRSSQARQEAKRAPAAAQLTMGRRIRKVGLTLAIPHLVVILSIVAIAVGALLSTSQSIALLPTITATAWLVFHAAPVAGDGVVLASVPLLPALITFALSARQVRVSVRKRFSIIDLLMIFVWSLVTPLLFTVVALLMLADAQTVYPVTVPPIGSVMFSIALVHLLAFVFGLGPKAWRALARRYGIPQSILEGVVIGAKTLLWLCLAAVIVAVIFLVVGWGRQAEIMAAYPQASGSGRLALVMLSLAYIPNIIVGVGGVLLGSEYQFGAGSVSLFETHLVPLPPLPVMGMVPPTSASWAWIGLFIPVAVIIVVMLRMRPSPVMTLSAGFTAWVLTAVAAYLSGGQVGAYSNTGLPVLWTASLALIWVGGIALAVTLMQLVFARRYNAKPAVVDELAVDGEEQELGSPEPQEPEGQKPEVQKPEGQASELESHETEDSQETDAASDVAAESEQVDESEQADAEEEIEEDSVETSKGSADAQDENGRENGNEQEHRHDDSERTE